MDQTQSVFREELTQPTRDRGSFRDPAGFVCHFRGGVFRAIAPSFSSLLRELDRSGLLRRLQHSGGLVSTRLVRHDEPAYATLRSHIPQVDEFLQHRRIPFVSYPYEWSPSMLAEAAICCLDLQMLLVEHGYSLKDASAYNVQFDRGQPVFIDVSSIEQVRQRGVWTALDQFYRMFLYPLLLSRYRKCSLKEYFLANLDGASLNDVYRRFGFVPAMRPKLWMDVWLPYQLQRFLSCDRHYLKRRLDAKGPDGGPLLFNLRRLRRSCRTLAAGRYTASPWLDYAPHNSYSDQAARLKKTFVTRFLDEHRIERLLDIGCNTGVFSELAARRGILVVAVDSDEACIDSLHRRARIDSLNIRPLVMDIVNPSPGIGFQNQERASFLDRASVDCVFALALLHHLLVTARIPLESVCDLLARTTSSYAVVEFVDPADPMFLTLLGARKNLYAHITLDRFLGAFARHFTVLSQAPISPHRTLVAFKKR